MTENQYHLSWLQEPVQLVGMIEKQRELVPKFRRNLESAAQRCRDVLNQNPQSTIAKRTLGRIESVLGMVQTIPHSLEPEDAKQSQESVALVHKQSKKPKEPFMNRRTFFTVAGISLWAAAEIGNQIMKHKKSPGQNTKEIEKKNINAQDFFNSIPMDIPGAAKDGVKKIEASDMKHCFVHIRDTHRLNDYELTRRMRAIDVNLSNSERQHFKQFLNSEEYSELKELLITNGEKDEKDIQQILEFLIQKGARVICTEGFLTDNQNFMNLAVESYRNNPQVTEEDKAVMKMQHDSLEKSFGKSVTSFLLRKDISVQASEDNRTWRKTGDLIKGRADPKLIKAMHEAREDFAVELASKRTLTVQIYGNGHDFSDAVIERWNRNHPVNKMSFIEITPASMEVAKSESKNNPFGLVFLKKLAQWEKKNGKFLPWNAIMRDAKDGRF